MISSAVVGGSLEVVKWLFEHGARRAARTVRNHNEGVLAAGFPFLIAGVVTVFLPILQATRSKPLVFNLLACIRVNPPIDLLEYLIGEQHEPAIDHVRRVHNSIQ